MLKRRGRHGDRTRRCRLCVKKSALAEASAPRCECGAILVDGVCAACTECAVDKQRRKLLKALRQVQELKQRRDEGDQLEMTQLDKIARESEIESQLHQLEQSSSVAAVVIRQSRTGKRRLEGQDIVDEGAHKPGEGGQAKLSRGSGTTVPLGLQTRFEIRAAKKQRKFEKKQESRTRSLQQR
eukprot:scaffold257033_cov31-Tisochrysis_lutea.AAC.2